MVEIAKPHLLIATNNRGKVKEIFAALNHLPFVLRFTGEFPEIPTPDENGLSYSENAIIKATSYAKGADINALADDSGLEVEALDAGPGLRSARLGGESVTNDERIALLLSHLGRTGDQERRARFVSIMVIVGRNLRTLSVAEGVCNGRIADSPAGSRGFGYDSIFIPDGYQQTFGELPPGVKNKISHRAQALETIRQFLAAAFKVVP